eukprot:scaffold36821_cov30-Phaeocystis_antarctica.AAC.1
MVTLCCTLMVHVCAARRVLVSDAMPPRASSRLKRQPHKSAALPAGLTRLEQHHGNTIPHPNPSPNPNHREQHHDESRSSSSSSICQIPITEHVTYKRVSRPRSPQWRGLSSSSSSTRSRRSTARSSAARGHEGVVESGAGGLTACWVGRPAHLPAQWPSLVPYRSTRPRTDDLCSMGKRLSGLDSKPPLRQDMCAVYRVVTGCEDARWRVPWGTVAGPTGPLAARDLLPLTREVPRMGATCRGGTWERLAPT